MGSEEVVERLENILRKINNLPTHRHTLPFHLPDHDELKAALDEVRLTTTEGRDTDTTTKRPIHQLLGPTAYDVARERDAKRPPDAWRTGDEAFMVPVGQEPEPRGFGDEPDSDSDDDEATLSKKAEEMVSKPREWQTTDEFVKQYSPAEQLELLYGKVAVGVGAVSVVEEAKVCAVCKKPINPLELVSGPNYVRHGTCWPP